MTSNANVSQCNLVEYLETIYGMLSMHNAHNYHYYLDENE